METRPLRPIERIFQFSLTAKIKIGAAPLHVQMIVSGIDSDTKVGDMVQIQVPNTGPYGMILERDRDGHGAIIQAWNKLPDGKYGPIQRHKGVHIGDAVVSVNNSLLSHLPSSDALKIINDGNILRKTLSFMSPGDYYTQKAESVASQGRARTSIMRQESAQPTFESYVTRARVLEEEGQKVVEYEIASQLRLASGRLNKNAVYKWSSWKRYSDFATLHKELSKTLGWQMEKSRLPPSHSMVWDKFSESFIDCMLILIQ